jgi:hypothetical protein
LTNCENKSYYFSNKKKIKKYLFAVVNENLPILVLKTYIFIFQVNNSLLPLPSEKKDQYG